MAVVSGSPSSSSILAPWRWVCSPNPKYRIEVPGLQRGWGAILVALNYYYLLLRLLPLGRDRQGQSLGAGRL